MVLDTATAYAQENSQAAREPCLEQHNESTDPAISKKWANSVYSARPSDPQHGGWV